MCVYMRVGERLGGAALTCERVHMHFLFLKAVAAFYAAFDV